MCTVTYIPTGESSYYLTSNRDESPSRGLATILPHRLKHNGIEVLAPIDQKAKGTWLLTTSDGITLCILNGAFQKHHHEPPYTYSRGLIPFKYLDATSTQQFVEKINLEGVEPFTLVICESGKKLSTLVWDGTKKHYQKLNPNDSHIWSSSTLYDEQTKLFKEQLFRDFLTSHKEKKVNPIDFHTIGRQNPIEPTVFIKREKVETVSTSMVDVGKAGATLFYQDYLNNQSNKLHL